MYLKEATSKRIIELCNEYHYTPNKLAEMSRIAPSTFNDMLNEKEITLVLWLSVKFVKL